MIYAILAYLLGAAALFGALLLKLFASAAAYGLDEYRTPIACGLLGGIGGTLYCLRAVYVNKCVRKQWDADWNVWYFVRPVTSVISGAVSYLFLKAGLILLEAGPKQNSSEIGFFALAFVAGLNVDRFVAKIEEIAQATWGIEKSRMAKKDD